eukprot:261957-Prymnesium_polylepis.2
MRSRSLASSSLVQTCFFHAPRVMPGLSSSSWLSDDGDCSESWVWSDLTSIESATAVVAKGSAGAAGGAG